MDNSTLLAWLMDPLNKSKVREMENYLSSNICSEEAQGFIIAVTENIIEGVDFDESLVIFDEGDKPLEEFDDICEGILALWQRSINSSNEVVAVLTADGAILITQEGGPNSGDVKGIYEHGGITYYQYPTSQAAPNRNYVGQLISANRYFIPIKATIHSHTPCLMDGTDGITNNFINDDQAFASHYSNIKHYIVGCGAVGQFNGYSNQAYEIESGSLDSLCNNIN